MDANNDYEIIIIGGGPAGLSAGIYAARSRRKTLLIEKGGIGGMVVNTWKVENYPGFESVSGIDLTQVMYQQAKNFGINEVYTQVTAIDVRGSAKVVKTTQGDYAARAVIVCGGLERQKLGVPGEAEYTGKGVSSCATCDGAFFRDKPVIVVGGGNSALTEALELTKFASTVTIIHRRNELRATKILQEKATAEPKLKYLLESAIEEIKGDSAVRQVSVRNVKTGQLTDVEVSGVFVSVGFQPNTGYLKGVVDLDENGSVIVNMKLETSAPGIFAAGDVRSGSIRQLIAAAGDGAVAAVSAEKYLSA